MYDTERKPKNKKQGMPGNEAKLFQCLMLGTDIPSQSFPVSSSNLVAFSNVSDQKLVSDVRTNQSYGAVVYNHWTGLADRNGWTDVLCEKLILCSLMRPDSPVGLAMWHLSLYKPGHQFSLC